MDPNSNPDPPLNEGGVEESKENFPPTTTEHSRQQQQPQRERHGARDSPHVGRGSFRVRSVPRLDINNGENAKSRRRITRPAPHSYTAALAANGVRNAW